MDAKEILKLYFGYNKNAIRIVKKRSWHFMYLCICLFVSGCGVNKEKETASQEVAIVQETEEVTETQEQQTEAEDELAILNGDIETEVAANKVEIETGETGTITEEETMETSEADEIAPISYEDYNVNNNGYSNYIEEYGLEDDKNFRIVICDRNSPDTLCDHVYDQTTYRGIALGDSREQVLEKYGEPYNEVVYMNHSWDHDGLEAQYNINYAYLDERYPEVFFCLSFNMDQNDNVLSVYYEAILMKWYEQNQ